MAMRHSRTEASWIVLGIGLMALGLGSCASTKSDALGDEAASEQRIAELRGELREMVAIARDRVFPALVNIEVVTLEFQGGKETKNRSTGSGAIISPDGLVLTNAHVTDDGYRFFCTLADKQRIPATLVGEDPWTDLALLKLDLSKLATPNQALAYAEFGNSDTLNVGDYVLAMGSPFALSRTVTLGIVSNTERVFTSSRDAGEVDEMMLNWEQRTGLFTNWIQHDALINPGNSGGPLVNLQGEIVGVNTRGGSGMAFATPSNLAHQVATSLKERGEVLRSSIGATFRHTQNTGIENGVLIDSVEGDGPAGTAGLQPGDVITSINGEPANVRFAEELPALMRRFADAPIGAAIRLTYDRKGETRETSITTDKLLRDRGEETALRIWGVTLQRITDRAAKLRRLDSTRGALVSSVRGGSPAATAEPFIGWGDVITSIDNQKIQTIQDAADAYQRIQNLKNKPEYVLINFEREGKDFLTLIKPTPDERPDPPIDLPKAWIGVSTQPVIKNLAEKLGSDEHRGFRITRVYTGTKASSAGLQAGDIITKINDTKVAPKSLAEAGLFIREVKKLPIDETVTLTIMRDGRALALPVVLESPRQSPEEAKRERDRDFEITVRDITFFDRQDNRWPDSLTGAFVDAAEPAGWASLGGIGGGDLIQKINGMEVTGRESFKTAMESVKAAQPEHVVFVVYRGSRTYFRFVEPDWKPTQR